MLLLFPSRNTQLLKHGRLHTETLSSAKNLFLKNMFFLSFFLSFFLACLLVDMNNLPHVQRSLLFRPQLSPTSFMESKLLFSFSILPQTSSVEGNATEHSGQSNSGVVCVSHGSWLLHKVLDLLCYWSSI